MTNEKQRAYRAKKSAERKAIYDAYDKLHPQVQPVWKLSEAAIAREAEMAKLETTEPVITAKEAKRSARRERVAKEVAERKAATA